MFGTMAFAAVMLYYKPDTRYAVVYLIAKYRALKFFCYSSIQSWALKEAKERMEARGEKYQYEPQSPPS